jgi:hypothetical protein
MESFRHFSKKSDKLITEDLNKFISKFRRYYLSGRRYSFREWFSIFSDLIEELE